MTQGPIRSLDSCVALITSDVSHRIKSPSQAKDSSETLGPIFQLIRSLIMKRLLRSHLITIFQCILNLIFS